MSRISTRKSNSAPEAERDYIRFQICGQHAFYTIYIDISNRLHQSELHHRYRLCSHEHLSSSS